jgi:hypothetical protein
MRYDKRDPDPAVIKLTRAGHYLWLQVRKSLLGSTVEQQKAILEPLEIIWEGKRKVKAELAAKRVLVQRASGCACGSLQLWKREGQSFLASPNNSRR